MRHYLRLLLAFVCLYSISSFRLYAQASHRGDSLMREAIETYPEFNSEQKDLVLSVLDSLPGLKLPHRIYGELELLEAKPDMLLLRTSSLSTWSLKLLPQSEGKRLYCVIETLDEPTKDSYMSLYSSSWQALNRPEALPRVELKDFIKGHSDRERLERLLSPLYTSYQYIDSDSLQVKVELPILLNDDTREEDKRLIEGLPKLRYRWNKSRWVVL